MALPRKRRKIFIAYRVGIILLLGSITVAAGRAAWNMYTIMKRSKAEAIEMQARHHELKERRDFLNGEIEGLATAYGTEAALREKYGVAKEGETQIIIVDEDYIATTTEKNDKKQGFWGKLKGWIGL